MSCYFFQLQLESAVNFFCKKHFILDVWLVLAPSSYNTVKCDIKPLSEMVGNTHGFKLSGAYELLTQF